MDDSLSFFGNYEDIFPQSLVTFNTLLPTLNKALYTNAVKLPAWAPEHINIWSYRK